MLHATVFLSGSDESIVNPDAADEAVGTLVGYLQRLQGPRLAQLREDLACIVELARQEKWQLGLSAVIEELNGHKSYWALAHPPGKPDFHHSDCFTYEFS